MNFPEPMKELKRTRLSYTKATNKPALFWKQRRNYLSIEWEKLTINTTSTVSVLPRLYPHRLYLHPKGRSIYTTLTDTDAQITRTKENV